ncbi:calcium/sodium antiporter [Methylophaga sp. SB9B]|uniref:calcium/sodium antiporter n=1 Tax=Methylophaga sp. SB9B TaxID=2570356 RepID=UPI0010A92C39|nr:calcium/sodium antiporter [Methylophaga sp. SB9B]THK41233.1 calcium/sodium antiporter [Methylophaga sp. SB9B]
MTWLMLAAGLVLLIVGAELLVKGASRLATSFGIPALVVGLTVVAFGTSAPELAVSVKAAFSGQAEMAIANVVGSNIFNILFILGLAALIMPLIVSQQLIRQDVPIMIGVSFLALWMIQDGSIGKLEAALLVLGVVLYTLFLFYQGKKTGIDSSEVTTEKPAPTWQNLLLIIVGLALLVLGARWLVQSAVTIASSFGVSEAVIGLTIVAAGTSLPEVMTSIIATIKGERDIAIGNVVGSNIFNILAVLGLSGLISPMPLIASEQLMQIDVPVMVAVAVLCLPLFFLGGTLNRFEGFLFLVLYVAYVWFTIAIALSLPYLQDLQTGLVYGLGPLVGFYVFLCLVNDLLRRRYK